MVSEIFILVSWSELIPERFFYVNVFVRNIFFFLDTNKNYAQPSNSQLMVNKVFYFTLSTIIIFYFLTSRFSSLNPVLTQCKRTRL